MALKEYAESGLEVIRNPLNAWVGLYMRSVSTKSEKTISLNVYHYTCYKDYSYYVRIMNDKDKQSLKRKIMEEMTVEYSSALEKNFDLAKKFIRITKDGRVNVLVEDKVSGKDRILLYLIGKLYAKEAGLTSSDSVGNKELMNELGIPEGSLLPWLMGLRKRLGIKQTKEGRRVTHYIPINLLEAVLQTIEKKLKKTG